MDMPKTITLSDGENKKKLKYKLKDYKKRLGTLCEQLGDDISFQSPQAYPIQAMTQLTYRIAIIEKLLKHESVNTHSLANTIRKENDFLNEELYAKACRIVNGYAVHGGKGFTGGTGFKGLAQ